MTEKRALIIGSGVAGLAAASRLAAKGYRTTVFEANQEPGGKIGKLEQQGYRFDTGPSLFTLPKVLDQVFDDCGRDPRNYFDYYRKEVACRYFWPDGTELTAWADRKKFAAEVEQKLAVSAQRVISYLEKSRYIYETTAPVFLERSLHRWQAYLKTDTLKAVLRIPKLGLHTRLHRLNAKHFDNQKLVQLFDRFATYNGSDPYQTPGVMSSIPHLEHNEGTYYPRGGMHQITQALYQLAQDMGVEFRFGEPVQRILVKKNQAQGLITPQGQYSGERLICNMDVVPAYRKLMPDQKAPEQTLKQERSSSALIFYWGIDRQFEQLDLHNIFFSADYQAEFNAIFQDLTVGEDPTVYVNISAKEDPTDAPPGGENWFVMINVPGDRGQDWSALIKKVRAQVIEKLSSILQVELKKHIVTEAVLDPAKIARQTSSFQGSLYGAASNDKLAAFFRHPNFSRRIRDLYFCGGSVHPGGGIPLSLQSARIATDLIEPA